MFVKTSDLPKLDQAQLMVEVQKRHGVSLGRQSVEILRLQKGRSALSPYEYFYYGLYNPEISWDDKQRYAGVETCRAMYLLANQFTWWQAAEDKLAFHGMMAAQGYPTPKLLAVASATRKFGGVPNLADEAAIVGWLRTAPAPLFGKPVVASHGVGGVQITAVDAASDSLTTDAGETVSIEVAAGEIAPYLKADGYLFQHALRPHPDIARITSDRVATLRIIVLIGPDGPSPYRVICRLPAGENRVDNFRRPGNLIGAVEPSTGVMAKATRGVGPALEPVATHPDSGHSLQDVTLPLVKEAVALALEASTGFPGLHIQSWDIALCPDGPVILEMNPGGNLNLVQLCTGQGALTPELHDFVRWCATLDLNTQVEGRKLALKRVG